MSAIRGYLVSARRAMIRHLGWEAEEEEAEASRWPVDIPEGWEESEKSLSEIRTPRTINETDYALLCLSCGGLYHSYWDWFNHLDETTIELTDKEDTTLIVRPDGSPGLEVDDHAQR